MKNWRNILIPPDTRIIDAIRVLNEGALQIVMVTGEDDRLLGTVTDGDVRRGILDGVNLEGPVESIMYRTPSVARVDDSREFIMSLMKSKDLAHIPLVDHNDRVLGLESWGRLVASEKRENPVIFIAGGLGSRLGAVTQHCPKPLLKVGAKPILESILEKYIACGFTNFFMAVNHKREMFQEHFGDGSRWNVSIRYIEEETKLGTAGPLGLFPGEPELPLIVMNADILTKIDFNHLLDYHLRQKAVATICVTEYDFQIPYGVVRINENMMSGIEEKPVHRFFVSAGIYVVEPEVLKLIPRNQYMDMPVLLNRLAAEGREVATFPIHEYWLDIGRAADLERANSEFCEVFV